MSDWTIQLRATATEEDAAAKFRAEALKLAALYGVQVDELQTRQEPRLRLVPPETPNPGAA